MELLEKSAKKLASNNIQITYLDASFPFKDGFPLLPHLSHNDGKKVDLSFMYLTKKGESTNKNPSLSGYGTYAEPKNYNGTQTERCNEKGYWFYDKSHYLKFGTINNVDFDSQKTRMLLKTLLEQPSTSKVLLEPHLKRSLNLNDYNKIRFHGCQAVRHDDHLHL